MNKTTAVRAALLTPLAVAAAATGMLFAAAPALAAESADVTIALLEAQGFDVRVDRVGSAPLDECVVTDIRNPREQQRFDIDNDDDNVFENDDFRRTISVSLDCSR